MGKKFDIDWEGVVIVVLMLLGVLAMLFGMCGCSMTKTKTKTITSVDTVYKASVEVRVDSVWVDRYRNVYVSGDTVYSVSTEYKEKYMYLDRVDTVWRVDVQRDVEYVERSVARERSWYDRFCSWGFWISLALIVLYVIYRVIKWWISR